MIWNSIAIMTLVDLAIIGIVVAVLIIATRKGLLGGYSLAALYFVSGMLFLGVFYLADLLIMHVGPLVVGPTEAMQVMQFLHLNVAWPVTLVVAVLLLAALLKFIAERSDAERQITLISERLPIAIIYVDAEERYRFVNPLYEKWYGRTRTELLGRCVRDIVSPEAYSVLKPHIENAMQGSEVGFAGMLDFPNSPVPRDIQSRLVPDQDERGEIRGFYALISDVTEQNKLERQVVAASERERNSIGRDLHDNLGQTLTGASLKLQALAQRLQNDDQDLTLVKELKQTIQTSIEDTRNLARLLAPAFDKGGLETALSSLASEASQLFGVECTADCQSVNLELNPETSTHIFRIAQESVTNAVRHGRARKIEIKCHVGPNRFVIETLDDGVGIEPRALETNGMGINTMRYRARMLGGDLRVEPRTEGGTRVVCSCRISTGDVQSKEASVANLTSNDLDRQPAVADA